MYPYWMHNDLNRLDWDNLRLLLALAETGSLRAAAIRAGVALNTLRSKVDALETMYGRPLIDRKVGGSTMTAAGDKLVATARKMRSLVEGTSSVLDG